MSHIHNDKYLIERYSMTVYHTLIICVEHVQHFIQKHVPYIAYYLWYKFLLFHVITFILEMLLWLPALRAFIAFMCKNSSTSFAVVK